MNEIIETIKDKLRKQPISARVLLSKFRFIDDTPSHESIDSNYVPFYYYLGCTSKAKLVLEFGFGIGIFSGSFLVGCPTVEQLCSVQFPTKEFYSPRIGISNIRKVYKESHEVLVGDVSDVADKVRKPWDVVLITDNIGYDKTLAICNLVWDHLSDKGLISIDFARDKEMKRAIQDFSMSRKRESYMIPTRYGTSIIFR